MQYRSKATPQQPIGIDGDTKAEFCSWYDNNEAGTDLPVLVPDKLVVLEHGDKWIVSYPFYADDVPVLLGTVDEPLL